MKQRRRRNRIILGLVALGLLAGVALTAGPAQAVDAVGPYYALPSWDRKMAPANRFVVLTNWNSEAVLDKETGLVWERSPLTTDVSWSGALSYCINKKVGERKGWRLPSIPELASLIDPTQSDPSLPAGHPFLGVRTVQNDFYWSATTMVAVPAGSPSHSWTVRFLDGNVFDNDKVAPNPAWCVRGGMNADAY